MALVYRDDKNSTYVHQGREDWRLDVAPPGCSKICFLILQQRSIKTVGGLTRGHRMTEIQRLVWLLSMPACAEVSHSMQDVVILVNSTKILRSPGSNEILKIHTRFLTLLAL